MYYVGVDLGGTNIKVGICDGEGNILKKGSIKTGAERSADEITKSMAELTLQLISEMGLTAGDIACAGIATPGTADSAHGVVVYCCNLPFLEYPLAQRFSDFTGIGRVLIENDANAAAKGESVCGAAKDYKNSITITLGTGVGGGIVIENGVYAGFNFAAAELGHIVIDFGGEQCACGRRGCWEQYASATALTRQTREMMEKCPDSQMWALCDGKAENASARTAFDAMRLGDKAGAEVVDTYIRYLACGVVNLVNMSQTEVLCIGGGVCNEGDYLLKPLLEIVANEQYSRHSVDKTAIKIAKLGNDAGIIGAAMLSL